MAYIVTKNILDSKDNNRLYEKGETYPRPDLTVSDNRIKELLGKGAIVSDGAEGIYLSNQKMKTMKRPKRQGTES